MRFVPVFDHLPGLFDSIPGGMKHDEVISIANEAGFPFFHLKRLVNRLFHAVQRQHSQAMGLTLPLAVPLLPSGRPPRLL